jgi:SAM-dependent methyltransferase
LPFTATDLNRAYLAYRQFVASGHDLDHLRFIFPFFAGTYFTYRKVDIMRIITIAKSISTNPSFVDIGCGYGDFLEKIRGYIPDAIGLENDATIFYLLQKPKPEYISSIPIASFDKKSIDLAFVGWMEPGVDFRKNVGKLAKCVITTFDQGGQCGINGGCEYEQFGFNRIAWWRTPSWIDVNTELMNKYYTESRMLNEARRDYLRKLRSAHNLWYVYSKGDISKTIAKTLKDWLELEKHLSSRDKLNFETILDECGFHYEEQLESLLSKEKLWEVNFD